METKVVKIKIKSVYGNELVYPANHEAELFAQLVGQKTLTKAQLEVIKALGYTIEVVNAYTI